MGVYKNNNGTLQPIAGRGGALIDDTLTTTSNTWSATKINNTFVTDANYTHTDNNYTDSDRSKLDSVATGAEVNVQADWEVTDNTSDAYIKNKPTILSTTGAGYHNSIYRGKNLGTSVTQEQWNAINSGTFDDMYIGDYWVINDIIWRIAAFDYWYNFGDTICTTHHIVIMPDSNLLNADGSTTHFMNDSNVTTGAYVGSGFHSGTNPGTGTSNTAKANCTTIVNNAFGSAHILTHREYLLNAVTNGRQSAGAWYDSTIEIPNEHMIYGKHFEPVSDGTNIPAIYTIDNAQLPLFIFDHSKICNRANWWLRDVVSASVFSYVSDSGFARYNAASGAGIGVRPVFAIY